VVAQTSCCEKEGCVQGIFLPRFLTISFTECILQFITFLMLRKKLGKEQAKTTPGQAPVKSKMI
jgi:cadmium resistance protein CadD (predicted permease)